MRKTALWPLLLMSLSNPGIAWVNEPAVPVESASLVSREQRIFKPAVHDSHFADVPHAYAKSRCEDTRPPVALATPNPLLVGLENDDSVTVSFIVGIDGKVHSPLILKGGDPRGDHVILDAIRHWRYRPATCNGVPTEVEAKVEFSRP